MRTARERLCADTATVRHETQRQQRGVWLESAADGMAYLTAFLPAAAATAIHSRVTNIAVGIGGGTATVRVTPCPHRRSVWRMGRIVFDTATTINGWIADENNSLDWLFAVPGGDEAGNELLPQGFSVLVEGSTTYEWVLSHEDVLAHPEKWRDFHGDRPTFVFTTRTLPVPDGADVRFVSGPVADALPAIRAAAGDGDIWVVGGGDLAGQFLDAGALDEIALSVAPVALPGGAPLLPRRIDGDRLHLVDARAVGPFARLVYRVRPV